jgi:predicted kinase
MKELILLRGIPGSGKTTLSFLFNGAQVSADDYFYNDETGYNFVAADLDKAHKWCQTHVENLMYDGIETIVVANTFTKEWEMNAYYELAKLNGYRVHSVIVENRHGSRNIHGVPPEKLEQMKNRFEIKL